MKDTPEEILLVQREIFFKKTASERSIFGAELIDFGRTIVESSIIQNYPDISPIDLKIEVFKRYYEDCFAEEELDLIIESMKAHFDKND